jgi:hypothetical protein
MSWPILDDRMVLSAVRMEAFLDLVHELWRHDPPLVMTGDPRWSFTGDRVEVEVDVEVRVLTGVPCDICRLRRTMTAKEAAAVLGFSLHRVRRHSMRVCAAERAMEMVEASAHG